ncbi:FkbM family methyltransferase [Nocardioides ultimimeridianus]
MTPTPTPAPSMSVDAAYRLFSNSTLVRSHRDSVPAIVLRRRMQSMFLRMCRDLEPTIAFEAGAHEATFSRTVKEQTPSARVVAFEANPHVHAKYAAELAAAGVDYVHTAVADRAGEIDLTIPLRVQDQDRPLDGTSASLGTHRTLERSEHVTVPAARLDDLVTVGPDDRVVAWIDVEGANGPVLESGREVLARTSLVYIEVESETVWDGQWIDVDVARFFAELGLVPILRDIQSPDRAFQHNVVYAAPEIASDRATARRAYQLFRPVEG